MAPSTVDPLGTFPYRSSSPFVHGATVAPSDGADLPDGTARALWIGAAGGGNLKVTMAGGDVVSFASVTAGLMNFAVLRVWNTGTDVTSIVALW